jgi:hypothetical protein
MDPVEAIVREYVSACNGEDIGRILGLLHSDVELHEAPALPGAVSAVGLDEVGHYLSRFQVHWSHFEWEPLAWEFAGDHALLHARLHLRGRNSGIEVAREWSYIFTVRDGKLLRQDGYDDAASARAAFERAAGAAPGT